MSEAQRAGQLANSGWAFYLAGNRQGALRDFRAALSIEPDHIDALTGLIQTQLVLNQMAAANETAIHLLKTAPNLAQAHRMRGEVLRRNRHLADAEAHVRKAIRLDPNEPIGYHYLAVILFERKRYREALHTVEEGRRLAPWYAVLAAQQALILLHLKGPKAAEPFADEALRMRGDDTYVLTNVARVMLMLGKLDKAHDLLEEVLRRDANDEEAISLYLLADPQRYRLLRMHVRFPFWRRANGVFGWVVWLGVWLLIVTVVLVAAVAGRVPAFVLAVGYQLFWRAQYASHRKRVRQHFAQPQLKAGF
jgi:tetratricopeptide (TPR) repeat protein